MISTYLQKETFLLNAMPSCVRLTLTALAATLTALAATLCGSSKEVTSSPQETSGQPLQTNCKYIRPRDHGVLLEIGFARWEADKVWDKPSDDW
jgi:hypothetical protein